MLLTGAIGPLMSNIAPPFNLLDKMGNWTSQLTTVDRNTQLSDVEKRDLMQTIVQSALDAVTKSFSEVSDSVLAEMSAGGQRAVNGNRALPHVQQAMAHVEKWAAMAKCGSPGEIMTELLETLPPLQKAYECIQSGVDLMK